MKIIAPNPKIKFMALFFTKILLLVFIYEMFLKVLPGISA